MEIRKVREEDAASFLMMLNQLDLETKNMMYEAGEPHVLRTFGRVGSLLQ